MSADWDAISYITSSSYRQIVMEVLREAPAQPSVICKRADSEPGIAHVSRALQGLRERGLVDLLVSEDCEKGRIYGLTESGEDVLQDMDAQLQWGEA